MDKLKAFWKKRKPTSHKGENGRVLIVGGSPRYIGAPALAGLAALRSGADLVTIAAPEKVAWAINCLSPDLITYKAKGTRFTVRHASEIADLANTMDAVLIGNGIGLRAAPFIRKVVPLIRRSLREQPCSPERIKIPLVLDADALKVVKGVKNCVLTPHRREFEIYSGQKLKGTLKEEIKQVMEAAGSNVILLKGKTDIIATSQKYKLNRTGNPGMTKGGTGDTLAGFCVGFIAQGMRMFEAACLAAEINGKIADNLARKYGYSYLASEITRDKKLILER